MSPRTTAAYGRGVLGQCWWTPSHVSRNSDDERGTPAAVPAPAWRSPAYQDAQCSNDWSAGPGWVTLLLHPGPTSGLESLFVLLCRRCLSRMHLNHTLPHRSTSCAGPFGKRGGPSPGLAHSDRSPTQIYHQHEWSPAQQWTMTAISTREYPHRRPLFSLRT